MYLWIYKVNVMKTWVSIDQLRNEIHNFSLCAIGPRFLHLVGIHSLPLNSVINRLPLPAIASLLCEAYAVASLMVRPARPLLPFLSHSVLAVCHPELYPYSSFAYVSRLRVQFIVGTVDNFVCSQLGFNFFANKGRLLVLSGYNRMIICPCMTLYLEGKEISTV